MSVRNIISALLSVTLLLCGGCARVPVPDKTDSQVIGFSAVSMVLTSETKTAVFKEGGEFAQNDKFDVYGRKNDHSNPPIFDGTDVQMTTKTPEVWSYTPLKYWEWENVSDYYDFLGVYPIGKSSRMDISGALAVKADYDIYESPDNFDLMMAGMRRKGNLSEIQRLAVVPLQFVHRLCAVRVIVTNVSKMADVTLGYYSFRDVIYKGSAKVSIDAMDKPEHVWINTQRRHAYTDIRKVTVNQTYKNKLEQPVAADRTYVGNFDFFIPGDLSETSNGSSDEDYMPHLILKYSHTIGDVTTNDAAVEILLKDVLRENGTPINTWEAGIKYTYHVTIRVDGGVLVKLYTTYWDDVTAETPGLLIH